MLSTIVAQVQGLLHKGKESGKHTPPDLEGQAEEGALDCPKDSGGTLVS